MAEQRASSGEGLSLDGPCSMSVASDNSSLCGDDPEIGPGFSDVELIPSTPKLGVSISVDGVGEKKTGRSVFEVDCLPIWGLTSVRGLRPAMEDDVAVVPRLLRIPLRLLIGDRVFDGVTSCLSHLTGHFFGVYDGHGGSQVAYYCRERIHRALTEELELVMNEGSNEDNCEEQWRRAFTKCFIKVDDEIGGKSRVEPLAPETERIHRALTEELELVMNEGSNEDNCEEQWRRAFTKCFIKVDDEIGGKSRVEPLAPETVGSTAVVAVVCSSHIIVANCGDSRAVLCRGKEPVTLSVDHKPNREDENARIEAAGGKVIQWNGHRVFGILAMSRSIGDEYLKPWIIPDPEVMFAPRAKEDECLIIASDGLWDVMTNEEVCNIARRQIQLWHKNNGSTLPLVRGEGIDPAAQAAAEYLSNRALQKGSKDNITIVVVDLKAQRKRKSRT